MGWVLQYRHCPRIRVIKVAGSVIDGDPSEASAAVLVFTHMAVVERKE